MSLKKQFEQALREAEGDGYENGSEFPDEAVEHRLAARMSRLEWYLAICASSLAGLTVVVVAMLIALVRR